MDYLPSDLIGSSSIRTKIRLWVGVRVKFGVTAIKTRA